MKRIAGLLAVLMLCCLPVLMLSSCRNPEQEALLNAVSGSWRSDDQKLDISGGRIEITGYYELDGHKLAGTRQEGTLSPGADGHFTVRIENITQEGYLKDENTLVLGETEYRRQ